MPKSTGRKRKKREAERQERIESASQETQGLQNIGEIELVFSSILGGIMLMTGLSRRSLPGLAFAATGVAFLYRGTTGYCKVYESLGLDTNRDTLNSNRSIDYARSGKSGLRRAAVSEKEADSPTITKTGWENPTP